MEEEEEERASQAKGRAQRTAGMQLRLNLGQQRARLELPDRMIQQEQTQAVSSMLSMGFVRSRPTRRTLMCRCTMRMQSVAPSLSSSVASVLSWTRLDECRRLAESV